MRRISRYLAPLALALATASGCAGQAYVVDDSPPPPREEVMVYRPGFVWVHGNWARRGHRWDWRAGHYERDRPGYVYMHGRWDHRGRNYVWVNGGWRARSGVVVRRY